MVFDVDSTLIKDEVIELLADAAGKRAEVAEVTERAMRGELDFAGSLIERVKTLAGLPETVIAQTYERIQLTDGVEELIAAIHERGGRVGAVSGGFNQLLEPLAQRLNLDFWRANQLEVAEAALTGKVAGEIIDREAKATALREWSTQLGLQANMAIAVGDGANDLAMMKAAGLGVAFNAKPKVREEADIAISGNDLRALISLLP